jgi:hypothetical protein
MRSLTTSRISTLPDKGIARALGMEWVVTAHHLAQ